MMYQYHDIHDSDFEKLVVLICCEILGEGVQGFSKGADGGKDGKFIGTANIYPSRSSSWSGTTIIQAKHTTGINKHFLESDFYSENSKSCIVDEEIEKIIKLIKNKELDNYMLFANRKLTGGAEPIIKKYIAEKTGLQPENIAILGIDDLDKWLAKFQYIVNIVNLTPLTISPIIRPDQLAEVIEHFSKTFNKTIKSHEFTPVERTTYEKKNELNNITKELVAFFNRNYMSYAHQVAAFLDDPQNSSLNDLYHEAVDEFQLRFVIPKQRAKNGIIFDEIFNDLVELLLNRDYILSTNIKLTRIMVFYMYWHCDIGTSEDD